MLLLRLRYLFNAERKSRLVISGWVWSVLLLFETVLCGASSWESYAFWYSCSRKVVFQKRNFRFCRTIFLPTMSKDSMGSDSLPFFDRSSPCSSENETETMNTHIYAIFVFLAETSWTSMMKQRKSITTHSPFRHYCLRLYAFVEQSFSKQL